MKEVRQHSLLGVLVISDNSGKSLGRPKTMLIWGLLLSSELPLSITVVEFFDSRRKDIGQFWSK